MSRAALIGLLALLPSPLPAAPDTAAALVACIDREAPRIERLEESLEAVGRIVVTVACLLPLRQAATEQVDTIAGGRPRPEELYASARRSLAETYQLRAIQAAITAREARLGAR